MSDNQSSNDLNNSSSSEDSDSWLPLVARFWILLPPNIASICCTLIVLFHIFTNRKARSAIKNHVLVILLLFGLSIQLIDVPFYLNFIVHSAVVPANPATCLIWYLVDIGVYNGTIILMTWMAFERHIIVFHEQWLSTRKRQIITHYMPLSAITLYIFIYYIYIYLFYPCENVFDYTSMYCGNTACYAQNESLYVWDVFANSVIPSLIEPFITLGFIVRVIWQKRHFHQSGQWRKQRKMTIQLMALTIPDFCFNFPLSVLYVAYLCGLPSDFGDSIIPYMYFLCYFISFIFSFICLVSIVDIKKIIREKIFRRQAVTTIAQFTATVKPEGYRTIMTTHV